MIHELWIESVSQTFCLSGKNGDAARALLEKSARCIWKVEANCHFDAMTKYYEYMDWGKYKSDFPEIDMQPYSERDDIFQEDR